MERRKWTRRELIVSFNLYCKLPFGQLHRRNPHVVRLAHLLKRGANSVAMKLVNFASLDPTHRNRGVSGLRNTSAADRSVWDEFNSDWSSLAAESELAIRALEAESQDQAADECQLQEETTDGRWDGDETEEQRVTTVRLGQAFFRRVVLASYGERCCVCQLRVRPLLVASHIIPWAANPALRVDPANGLCLCVMHDRAFDRGLVTVDEKLAVCIGTQLREAEADDVVAAHFMAYAGQPLTLPEKFKPKDEYFAFHREQVFSA